MFSFLRNFDFIGFKNQSRFGLGLDVFFGDSAAVEIDLGLGMYTLTIVYNK
jgi:hypothetical protein